MDEYEDLTDPREDLSDPRVLSLDSETWPSLLCHISESMTEETLHVFVTGRGELREMYVKLKGAGHCFA